MNSSSGPLVSPSTPIRLTAWVHGHVQGVGFRWATRRCALSLGLRGFASNYSDGRVLVIAEGPASAAEGLLQWLRSGETPGQVETVVDSIAQPHDRYDGFDIR